jgi:AcrR family transcriptional regulator
MPRPRFNKLTREKQEWIIEIAAKEFAAEGFEGASLNRILELAGISKGSAYYYFDDKVDVFLTVVQRYLSEVTGSIEALALDQLDIDNFWSRLAEVYRQQWAYAYERPWLLGAVKAAGKLSKKALANEALASIFAQVRGWLLAIFRRGQEVGAVRTDLPDDLLLALIQAVDDANDKWLLDHRSELQREAMEAAAGRAIDLLYRLLAP